MSAGPLRRAIEMTAAEHGLSMKDLTVLAVQNDPYRVDTDARHRDGEWLAVTARGLGLGDRKKIHLRGLHYMVIGRPKPDGTPYTNTEQDWLWLSGDAAKAARWLRYIPWEQIVDQRNSEPVVRVFKQPDPPWPYLHVVVHVDIPDVNNLHPRVNLADFTGVQPYKLVMIGEKSSLDDVLSPVAARYGADLYLPTGEPSDTMLYRMAQVGADDGRPMVVLYFSDADPSGWQMPISVARKLQAFRTLLFPDLRFSVHRVALTPDQVREYGLPSTPLKDTERRADRWREATGVEQTEIDALASLRPDLLRQIARDAVAPFYDATLDWRVAEARSAWLREAQSAVDQHLDAGALDVLRSEAADKLAELRAEIGAINDALRVDVRGIDLPPIPAIPDAVAASDYGLPLLDSDWPFAEQCRRLIDSKNYRGAA